MPALCPFIFAPSLLSLPLPSQNVLQSEWLSGEELSPSDLPQE